MRGASALDRVLDQLKDADLRVFVVWEPVLKTDVAPPLSRVLALIDDSRVAQYWDPDRVLSADFVRSVNEAPSKYGVDGPLPSEFIAWDVVAVFGRSARWDRDLPPPDYYGGPVIQSIDEAGKAIDEATRPEPSPVPEPGSSDPASAPPAG